MSDDTSNNGEISSWLRRKLRVHRSRSPGCVHRPRVSNRESSDTLLRADRQHLGRGGLRLAADVTPPALRYCLVVASRPTKPSGTDAALAGGLFVFGVVEITITDRAGTAILLVAMSLQTWALVWRRTAPLVAATLSVFGVALELLTGATVSDASGFLGFLVLAYSVPRYGTRRHQIGAGMVLFAGVAIHEFGSGYPSISVALVQSVFDVSIGAAAWGIAVAVRRRVALSDTLGSENAILLNEWASREHSVIEEERRRIARELHDIVGHSLAAISLSAGAAELAGASAPEEVGDALAAIRRTAQDAAGDVRRLVGILRTDSDQVLAPQPNLASLPELIRSTMAAGLPVCFTTSGEGKTLTAGVQLAVYRIVQEGLTNVIKHAPGSPTRVGLRWSPDSLVIEIANDGPIIDQRPDRSGHGLAGVRERVELYDGTFDASPRPSGGFRLEARLPLP